MSVLYGDLKVDRRAKSGDMAIHILFWYALDVSDCLMEERIRNQVVIVVWLNYFL